MTSHELLPLALLASSLLPGLIIFGLPENWVGVRTFLNLFAAIAKLGLVAMLLAGVAAGEAYGVRYAVLPGLELAWLGDGNNVLHSLIEAAGLMKFNIRVGGPKGYEPNARCVEEARARGAKITFTQDAAEAAAGAQVVVTDTWVSMGQPGGDVHVAAMQPYQVDAALMAKADPKAVFMHCLPAHRGEEVTDAVIDGAQSVVWDEAENRIHAQKSVLRWALGQL